MILFHLQLNTDLHVYSYGLIILKIIRSISSTGKQGYFKGFCNHKSELEGNLSMFTMNDLLVRSNVFADAKGPNIFQRI